FNILNPVAAIAAPAIAPINACEELLGIPKYQVIRFQAIAAISAAIITSVPFSNANGSTISFVMVFATPVNVIAPAKFINEANIIHDVVEELSLIQMSQWHLLYHGIH